MGSLSDQVAVVTGGGSGIGKAIAAAFAAEGCHVVIAGRSIERLEACAQELPRAGGDVVCAPTDVADEDQVKALFAETMRRFGRVDILVNSSGAFDGGRVDQLSLRAWQHVMDVNVTGPFLCTREAFAIMKDRGGGRIINIGSISAQMPREHSAPYATSKFAIEGLTRATALDGRPFNIAASCLHPGNTLVERRMGPTTAGLEDEEEPMMAAEEVGRVALLMATLPPGTNLLEAIVLPVAQKYVGRG